MVGNYHKLWMALLGCLLPGLEPCGAQTQDDRPPANEIRIVELQGTAEVSPAGATTWVLTQTNQVLRIADRLRVGRNSRVALRWTDQSVIRLGAGTELEVLSPAAPDAESGLHLFRGVISFFHRDKPGRIRVISRGATAGVEGTEFVMAVAPDDSNERTSLAVIDGQVRLSNAQGSLVLTNGQSAEAVPGQPPVQTAGFIVNNLLQWCFYYPAVLDLADLPLTEAEQTALADSLAAYRSGDLLAALAKYPADRQPGSDAERVYHAALLLSVGQVARTEAELEALADGAASDRAQRLAAALRLVVAAVKRQEITNYPTPELATECLAASYYEQSRATPNVSLERALHLARQAVTNSSEFAFGWVRVAELEFSFGRTDAAFAALNQSLTLSPRNAQALALNGFLLAAAGQSVAAVSWFDEAIAVDAALGNAWLGRGLCRIYWGDAAGGREDLLVAAALEPQRATLRSYLGKAYANAGDPARALKELQLAKDLDPNDPTAWLYSALLKQEGNKINEAIRDLEQSQKLNDHRGIYRSQLLLDQDRAVRSANLAAMYRDAGMADVGMREAIRAVHSDYGNYSAHQFLADSYIQLRDFYRGALRYETATVTETRLANLLSPASSGVISPAISQGEYSRLFERDRIGVISGTEYFSRGAWLQSGAQYGISETLSYSLEGFYRTDPGHVYNNDYEERGVVLNLKHQFTPQDSAYFMIYDYRREGGDTLQRYDPTLVNRELRFKETQEPVVGFGYHHEWSPGNHTIAYLTRLEDTFTMSARFAPSLLANRPDFTTPGVPELIGLHNILTGQELQNRLEIFSGELQQIIQQTDHTSVLGLRAHYGEYKTRNWQRGVAPPYSAIFPAPPDYLLQQDVGSYSRRITLYGYHQWQLLDSLQLIGGVAGDWLVYPRNRTRMPLSDKEETEDEISPKAGFIWNPATNWTVRFAYTRSLSGASLDQSTQLEPAQVAGFVQSFRNIIPESVDGDSSGARFETYGLSLEHELPTRTYLAVSGEVLNSKINRIIGSFDSLDTFTFAVPAELRQHLDFYEPSLVVTVNQLLGNEWSLGTRYRLSQAVLKKNLIDIPDNLPFNNAQSPRPRERLEGLLQTVELFAIYNHPSGFFTRAESLWYHQENNGYAPNLPGYDFWQFNCFAGYRFPRRRAELSVGVLNLTDQDYRLNPLNMYNELPRERTLTLRFLLNF